MLRKHFIIVALHLSIFHILSSGEFFDQIAVNKGIVKASKRIYLVDYPDAYNPAIIKFGQGYLLSFRYSPERYYQPWISYIGVVLLDESFEPISKPELLKTRYGNSKTPSQSEDARIFFYRGRTFVIYNDNLDVVYPAYNDRRDIFIAELFHENDHFALSAPKKLIYEAQYNYQWWQKNWIPFESNKLLLLSYSLNPHEVIYANLANGTCFLQYSTSGDIDWKWGKLRGSTPPELVDGEYLAFFHSSIITSSPASWDWEMWHYFMGAYTFSAEPPFQITKISPTPIYSEEFYTHSDSWKRVVFPGGFVISGSNIYVAYGKDDCELWIATLDKEALMNSLVPVTNLSH